MIAIIGVICTILQTIILAVTAYLGLMKYYKKPLPPLQKLKWQSEFIEQRKRSGME